MTPHRIQRKRTRGWKMPENTVYVGRGTKWGNPFRIGGDVPGMSDEPMDAIDAVHMFRLFTVALLPVRELRGKNLACWCPETPGEKTCHADILLELANASENSDRREA